MVNVLTHLFTIVLIELKGVCRTPLLPFFGNLTVRPNTHAHERASE